MSLQMTLKLIPSGTSSRELELGATPLDKLVGMMNAKSLLVRVPANHFQFLATNEDSTTSATFGRRCFGSSESFDLGQSLASKLLQRGHCDGGTLWRVAWKWRTTPQLRSICQLQVSERPTFGTAYSGWPTPMASNQYGISPEAAAKETDRMSGVTPLRVTVVHQLSGVMLSGSRAEMENCDQRTEKSTHSSELQGQLNPALPRWLMGLPVEWDIAVLRAAGRSVNDIENTQEARMMRLRGYGNAIVAPVAIEFIKAFMER